MRLRSTSTQRTYRYLRLSLLGAVVFIGVAVGAQLLGGHPLASISASYYTPARNAFVGGLLAVSVALLALSGRSVEQALLDLAAVLAPVIALVPVPVRAGDVPGVSCPDAAACLPPAAAADLAAGMLALAVVGPLVLVASLVLAAVQRTFSRSLAATVLSAAALLGGAVAWWLLSPGSFAQGAHYAATAVFFLLIAAVAILAAFRPAARTPRRRGALRLVYAIVAAGTAASLIFLLVAVFADGPGSALVLYAEAAALLLFAAFWLVQSVEFWGDADPALVGVRRE